MCYCVLSTSPLLKKKGKNNEHVSAVFQRRLPKKCEDPGMFSIPISIEDMTFDKAMLDLGASINVMPHHIFEQLLVGPIHPTNITI